MKTETIKRLIEYLLVLGIATSTFTALRLPSIPVGISDIFLLASLLLFFFLIPMREIISSINNFYFICWLVLSASLISGYLFKPFNHLGQAVGHSAIAYLYCSLIAIILSQEFINITRALKLYFLSLSALFILTILLSPLLSYFLHYSIFYGKVRLTYFSANPNQLACSLVAAPFLLLFLLPSIRKKSHQPIFALSLILLVVSGWLTRAQALTVSWECAGLLGGVYIFIKIYLKFKSKTLNICLWAVMLTTTLLAYLFFTNDHAIRLVELHFRAPEIAVRFALWKEALRLFSLSPLTGYGPGAFINGFHSILLPGFRAPYIFHFINSETHNTFLGTLLQSGSIGLLVYLSVLLRMLYTVVSSRSITLVLSMLSILVFSLFHFILREPALWFFLITTYRFATLKIKSASHKNMPHLSKATFFTATIPPPHKSSTS